MKIDRQQLKLGAAQVHVVSARNHLQTALHNLRQAKDLPVAVELLKKVEVALVELKEV